MLSTVGKIILIENFTSKVKDFLLVTASVEDSFFLKQN